MIEACPVQIPDCAAADQAATDILKKHLVDGAKNLTPKIAINIIDALSSAPDGRRVELADSLLRRAETCAWEAANVKRKTPMKRKEISFTTKLKIANDGLQARLSQRWNQRVGIARAYVRSNPMVFGICPHLSKSQKDNRIEAELKREGASALVDAVLAMKQSKFSQSKDVRAKNLAGMIRKIDPDRTGLAERILGIAFRCAAEVCLIGKPLPATLTRSSPTEDILKIIWEQKVVCSKKLGKNDKIEFLVSQAKYREYMGLPLLADQVPEWRSS